jgi:hypothetical protein
MYRRASEVGLMVAVAAFAIWLAADAAIRSPTFENLVLLVPGAVLTVLLSTVLAVRSVSRPAPAPTGTAEAGFGHFGRVLGLLALLAALVASLETIGFDVAGFLFLAISTWMLGERRPLHILGFAAITSFLVVSALQAILPFDMPTLVIGAR